MSSETLCIIYVACDRYPIGILSHLHYCVVAPNMACA